MRCGSEGRTVTTLLRIDSVAALIISFAIHMHIYLYSEMQTFLPNLFGLVYIGFGIITFVV